MLTTYATHLEEWAATLRQLATLPADTETSHLRQELITATASRWETALIEPLIEIQQVRQLAAASDD